MSVLFSRLVSRSATRVSVPFYNSFSRYFSSFSKIYPDASSALKAAGLSDGQTLLVGGFGLCGIPMACIEGVRDSKVRSLTVVSNNAGVIDYGLGILLQSKQVKRMISSYVGENAEFERQYLGGELELELTPQGTLAEKLRCGGAGIPAFYTRTAVGTVLQTGGFPIKYNSKQQPEILSKQKEVKSFNGTSYVLEESIRGELGLVKAWKADTSGNLMFRGTAQNFNPDCAKAADFTIAEVEEIVPVGTFKPEEIHVPSVYVKAIIQANREKRIERPAFSDASGKLNIKTAKPGKADSAEQQRERIVRRAALELKDGMNVNLGIGMPTLASNYLPAGVRIMLQSENGLLGMGPYPQKDQLDADLINAGKETVTTLPGSSIFSSSESFGMIRGGHIDISILGSFEVDQTGSLSSWIVPGSAVKGPGGSMDLVSSGSRIVVLMSHTDKWGKAKIKKTCQLPYTGLNCVSRIITDLAVFDFDYSSKPTRLILREISSDCTVDKLRQITESEFIVADDLKPIQGQ
jgi:3-oxoacid CoA-transferase